LPAGRYVVQGIDEAPALLLDEEAGIETALESCPQGRVVDANLAREIHGIGNSTRTCTI